MLLSTKSSRVSCISPRYPPANYKLPEDLQDFADLRRSAHLLFLPFPSLLVLLLYLRLLNSLVPA